MNGRLVETGRADFSPDIRHILCAADLSEHAVQPMRHAAALGRRLGGEVTVLHVIDGPLHEHSRWNATARFIVHEIDAEARVLPADLLVVGPSSHHGADQNAKESVTEMILRSAPCPVLVSRPSAASRREGYRRIVCALNFGSDSRAHIRFAFAMAGSERTKIIVVRLREAGDVHSASEAPREPERVARNEFPPLCDVTERIEEGNACHEILRVIEEEHADLLILSAERDAVHSSLAESSSISRLARLSPCSVLFVPAEERTTARPISVSRRHPALTQGVLP